MKITLTYILIGLGLCVVFAAMGGCATYRGMQSDVHRVTNPHW